MRRLSRGLNGSCESFEMRGRGGGEVEAGSDDDDDEEITRCGSR